MSFISDKKGQGALEYLLIIGAAILIAAVVIMVLVNMSGKVKSDINDNQNVYDDQINKIKQDLNNQASGP